MANTLLNYDTQGFIVGLRRVEQQTKGVQRDTSKIVQILTEQRRQNQASGQSRNESRQQERQNRHQSQRVARQQQANERRTQQRVEQQQRRESQRAERQVERQQPQRDEQGRFSRQAEVKEQNNQLSQMLTEQLDKVLQQNADGLDPVLDSLNEVRDMFSPLANGLGMMWKGGMWSAQKLMKFRRQEPRSREERTHDDAVEEQLENIARNTQNTSGGGGLFGGLFGRLFGRGGLFAGGILGVLATGFAKFFKSKGFLGAILGAGGLALNWDKLSFDEKGQGIGRVGGMVAGGMAGAAVGSALGPIGTIIGGLAGAYFGGDAGETLAKVAIPQIQSWTTQLKNYNLAGKIKGLWESVTTSIGNAFSSVPDHVKAAFDGAIDFIKNGFSKGLEPGKGLWESFSKGLESGKGLWESFKDTAKSFISGLPGGQAVLDMVGAGTASSGAVTYTPSNTANAIGDSVGRTQQQLKKTMSSAAFMGACATIVTNSLQNAGIDTKGRLGNGRDVAGNLLQRRPDLFEAVQYSKDYVPQKGDIMSISGDDPVTKARHLKKYGAVMGHVAIYDGEKWVSQINQRQRGNTAAPNDAYYQGILNGTNKVTIARAKGGSVTTTAPTTSGKADGKVSTKAAAGIFNPYFQRNIDTILSVYNQMGVPKNVQAGLLAQISAESGFNHNAVSPKGAFGVSQFLPGTAKRFGVQHGDVASQARGQVKYMQYLMKNFTKGDWNGALQAYNAGEGNYQKYRGNIPFAETRGYVKKVNERTPIFQKYLDSRTGTPTTTPTVTPPKPPAVKAPTTKTPPAPNPTVKRTGTERMITAQNTPQQITQNISDRHLAHAITGGLGMDRYAV